jgi:hypothetical protein
MCYSAFKYNYMWTLNSAMPLVHWIHTLKRWDRRKWGRSPLISRLSKWLERVDLLRIFSPCSLIVSADRQWPWHIMEEPYYQNSSRKSNKSYRIHPIAAQCTLTQCHWVSLVFATKLMFMLTTDAGLVTNKVSVTDACHARWHWGIEKNVHVTNWMWAVFLLLSKPF